jgi:hypothetical protein
MCTRLLHLVRNEQSELTDRCVWSAISRPSALEMQIIFEEVHMGYSKVQK